MKEKRLVTVLYADLAGFTRLTAELGAEKTTDFINTCFGIIDSIIVSYGGTVLRHEGDRVMAVYGFPKSRGRDSYYGLVAALRIKEAAQRFSYPVGIHIGVATGEVIIEGIDLYGQVIEEASHLESLSSNGELCVNRNCHEMNRYHFDFAEANDEGYAYFKVLSEKTVVHEYRTGYLDREKESAELLDLVDRKVKLIAVVGPAGIGKTRFVHETMRTLNREERYSFYDVSFLGSSSLGPYGGITRLMRAIDPEFKIGATPELSDERYRLMLFKNFTRILEQDSTRKPVLILLESVDLVDRDSLEYLKFLAGNVDALEVTLIIETRGRSREVLDAISGSIRTPVKSITIQPLPRECALRIIEQLTMGLIIPADLVEKMIDFSQGNPLYIEESCHYIIGEHRLGKNPREIVLPFRLRELAGYIIDTIPSNFLWGLSIFSAYGYDIDKRVLRALLPDYNEFARHCIDDNLIKLDTDRLFFKTAILRDELYARLSKSMRQKFHGEIAKVLEEQLPAPENFGAIARHYENAQNLDKALHYTLEWAQYLKEAHLTEQAIETYDRALNISSCLDTGRRFEILCEKSKLLNRAGKRLEELATVEGMLKIAAEAGDQEWLYRARLAQAYYFDTTADYGKACALYESLQEQAESSFVLERLGLIHFSQGNMGMAQDMFGRILHLAQAQTDARLEANARQKLGMLNEKLGSKEKALENYEQARTILEREKDKVALGYLTAEFGNLYFNLSRFGDAQRMYAEGHKIAAQIGDEVFKAEMLRKLGNVSYAVGDFDQEISFLKSALEINKRILNRRGEADVYHNMAITLGDMGNYVEALKYFAAALEIDRETGHQEGIALHQGDMGTCLKRMGKLDEAQLNLEKCLKILEQLQLKDLLSFYYREYALVQHLAGQTELAKKSAEKSIQFASDSDNAGCEVLARSTLANLCLKTGDIERALRLSNEAMEKLERISDVEGSKAFLYHNHHLVLQAQGRHDEASAYLKRAYDDIRSKGEKISDPEHRALFYSIEENKSIITLWEDQKKPS